MTERFALRSYEELPPEVRPLADDILKISSAGLGGPYNALMRSPEMARRCFDLLDYLRFKTSVPKAHQVNDALWQKAMQLLGEQQVIDLIVLSGTYTMVSMLLNATQVGIPNQGQPPLEVLSPETIRQRLLA